MQASASSSSSSASRGTRRRAASTKLAHQKYELNYNAKAHPRNRYGRGREADFTALAERHSDFADCTTIDARGERRVNWQNPDTVYQLTRALLQDDFGLSWTLPKSANNLRPPIPRTLNYLHWVEDLLLLAGVHPDTALRGIDVGTGASCIFPLLACAMHPQWTFLATDTISESVNAAVANVKVNKLNERISVLTTQPNDLISGAISKDGGFWHSIKGRETSGRYAFTLCNPPFFASSEHAPLLKSSDDSSFAGTHNELFFALGQASDSTVTSNESVGAGRSSSTTVEASISDTGKKKEPVTKEPVGGEVAFVCLLIDDSVASPTNSNSVVWFTSMLGRKSSLVPVLSHMRDKAPKAHVRTTTLYQGKTLRWAIAWSFLPALASLPSPKNDQLSGKKRMRQDDDVNFRSASKATFDDLRQYVTQIAQSFADTREQVSQVQVHDYSSSTKSNSTDYSTSTTSTSSTSTTTNATSESGTCLKTNTAAVTITGSPSSDIWLLVRVLGNIPNQAPLALCTFAAHQTHLARGVGVGNKGHKRADIVNYEQEATSTASFECTLQWIGGTQRSMFQRLANVVKEQMT